MAGSFPTSVTAYTNPGPTDATATAIGGRTHDQFHADVNDDLEQVMTKLGTGSSTASANTVLRGTGSGATAYGQIVDGDVSPSAAIAGSKLGTGSVALDRMYGGGTPYRVLGTMATGTVVEPLQVIGAMVAAETITNTHILDGTIRSYELEDGAVTTAKILAGAVTAYTQVVGSSSSPTQNAGPTVVPQMTMTPTLVGGGVQLLIFECTVENTAASAVTQFSLRIGGSNVMTRAKVSLAANERTQIFIVYVRASVAGTPTIDVTWLVTGGVATAIGTERSLTSIEWKK